MSELSAWAGRMKPTEQLYHLERENDTTGLYMMKEHIGNGVPCYMYTSPIYYVWVDDVMVFSTMDIQTAYSVYKNRRQEIFEVEEEDETDN